MVLLTGASGFLGRAITRALIGAGYPVRILVRSGTDVSHISDFGITSVTGDLNDPESLLEACAGVDTIIHAAAMVSFQAKDRDRLLKVNGEGTANLVNMALEAGVRRFVHLSSVAVLNRVDGGPVVTLKDRWPERQPNTAYAASKFAAEREVWRGQAEGLSVAVLYPSTILGAGNWAGNNTPALWRMAAAEGNFYPDGTAGFVALADVVEAVLFVLARDQDGERFLLNAVNLPWWEVQTLIAQSVGARPPSRRMPRWQSALLWPLEALRAKAAGTKPLITRETHRKVQARYRYAGEEYAELSGNTYRDIPAVIQEIGRQYLQEQGPGN